MFFGAVLGLETNMDTIWIGLSQGDDGVYAWVDGTTDVTTTNWAEDYPGMPMGWGRGRVGDDKYMLGLVAVLMSLLLNWRKLSKFIQVCLGVVG